MKKNNPHTLAKTMFQPLKLCNNDFTKSSKTSHFHGRNNKEQTGARKMKEKLIIVYIHLVFYPLLADIDKVRQHVYSTEQYNESSGTDTDPGHMEFCSHKTSDWLL